MLDFGWLELLVIGAVAVLVIGPQEIPKVMLGLGRIVRRLQYIKYAFSQQFEEFMRQSDLKDIQESVNFEASRQHDDFDENQADEELENHLPASHASDTTKKPQENQTHKGEQQ